MLANRLMKYPATMATTMDHNIVPVWSDMGGFLAL